MNNRKKYWDIKSKFSIYFYLTFVFRKYLLCTYIICTNENSYTFERSVFIHTYIRNWEGKMHIETAIVLFLFFFNSAGFFFVIHPQRKLVFRRKIQGNSNFDDKAGIISERPVKLSYTSTTNAQKRSWYSTNV